MFNYNIKNIVNTHFKINSTKIKAVFLFDFFLMFLGLILFNLNSLEYNKVYANYTYLFATLITISFAFMKKSEITIYLNSSCSRKDINMALIIINLILSAFLLITHILSYILLISVNSKDLNAIYIFMDNLKSLSILIAIIVFLLNIINYIISILSNRNFKIEKYFLTIFWIIIFFSPFLMGIPINIIFLYIYEYTDIAMSFALMFLSFVLVYFIGSLFIKKADL